MPPILMPMTEMILVRAMVVLVLELHTSLLAIISYTEYLSGAPHKDTALQRTGVNGNAHVSGHKWHRQIFRNEKIQILPQGHVSAHWCALRHRTSYTTGTCMTHSEFNGQIRKQKKCFTFWTLLKTHRKVSSTYPTELVDLH